MILSELRESVRSKADEQATGFAQNPEILRFINQACRFIHNKLTKRAPEDFHTEGTLANGGLFQTGIGVSGYNLPANAKRLVRVEARQANSSSEDDFMPLARVNIGDQRGQTYYPVREGYHPLMGYFPAAGTSTKRIYIRPTPQDQVTIRVWFVPKFTDLVNDADEPAFDSDYHELAAELAALQVLGKSGEPLFAERMKLYEIEVLGMEESAGPTDSQAERMIITDPDINY